MPELMSKEEIHDFGIEVVFNQLKKTGYEINVVDTNIESILSIVATKDDNLTFIAVRTEVYPGKGELGSDANSWMIKHAKDHNAIPYFASVGIANAKAQNEKERSIPIKGAAFYVAYHGLLMITTSDKVKIIDEDGARDLNENDFRE